MDIADIDLATQRRKRREEIARINGFDEVSDKQREKNLALNMALKGWPREGQKPLNYLLYLCTCSANASGLSPHSGTAQAMPGRK